MTTSLLYPIADGTKVRARRNAALEEIQILVVGAHIRTYYTPQSLVCTDAAVHNLTVPGGATHADVTFEGAGATTDFVRYWHGPTDPSSGVGVVLVDQGTVQSADPSSLTFIKGATGGGGTIRAEFYSYE